MHIQLHFWLRTLTAVLALAGLAGLIVIALVGMAHHLYFAVLPQWAIKKYKRSDPERLRRYLERVVATPSLFGPAQKLVARGALVGIYLPQGRHDEAAAHCRANLASLDKARHLVDVPALEADIRRRLADCLEALGQVREADQERHRAEACIGRAPDDPLRHLTRGTLLERENRYAEACAAFEQALSLTPESNRAVRIECMAHLLVACFNAGRPDETVRWAGEMIALGAEGRFLLSAHRMAGVAYGNLGRLEESEEHCRRAYELATNRGDPGGAGQILGQLADIQRERGKLAEAHEASLKAAALDPNAARQALAVQAYVLSAWGRFEEALQTLRRYGEGPVLVIPALERRLRAAVALDMCRIESESGRIEDAWAHIQEAVSVLGDDAKLGLQCDAAAAWVFAVRGLADDSRRVAAQAEARLPEFAHDRSTRLCVLFDLGMAAWTRGDYEDGDGYWSRYLELGPNPVYRPTALYFRGEGRRHRGNTSAARADFREAVAMDIDTHYARLARRRLGELTLEGS